MEYTTFSLWINPETAQTRTTYWTVCLQKYWQTNKILLRLPLLARYSLYLHNPLFFTCSYIMESTTAVIALHFYTQGFLFVYWPWLWYFCTVLNFEAKLKPHFPTMLYITISKFRWYAHLIVIALIFLFSLFVPLLQQW